MSAASPESDPTDGESADGARQVTPAELVAEIDDDFLRLQVDPGSLAAAWVDGRAALWRHVSRTGRAGWCSGVGDPATVARLFRHMVADAGAPYGVSLPRGTASMLPGLHLELVDDWEWMRTRDLPAEQRGEDRVRWLDDVPDAAIAAFLAEHSPRHSSAPGAPEVRRWCGVTEPDGSLAAVAAHTVTAVGVPHLASIATRTDLRGRGLGRAVTAWVTRRLLESGAGVVTLGMYSDNAPARRVYHRLGYASDHAFTSGRVAGLDMDGLDGHAGVS